jgi:hypothetical protein
MSAIPLDFQRRCEQRWAAKFSRPAPATPRREIERQDQELPTTGEPKTMTQRATTAGLRSASAG